MARITADGDVASADWPRGFDAVRCPGRPNDRISAAHRASRGRGSTCLDGVRRARGRYTCRSAAAVARERLRRRVRGAPRADLAAYIRCTAALRAPRRRRSHRRRARARVPARRRLRLASVRRYARTGRDARRRLRLSRYGQLAPTEGAVAVRVRTRPHRRRRATARRRHEKGGRRRRVIRRGRRDDVRLRRRGRGQPFRRDRSAPVPRRPARRRVAPHAPLLIVGSRDDAYLPIAGARELLHHAGSSAKRLVLYPSSWHGWQIVENAPYARKARAVVLAWLRSKMPSA